MTATTVASPKAIELASEVSTVLHLVQQTCLAAMEELSAPDHLPRRLNK